MASITPAGRPLLHPLHAIFTAFPVALFTTGLLTDIAYLQTAEIQWTNFSAWLIFGALIGGGVALLWAVIAALHTCLRRTNMRLFVLLLGLSWLLGLVNAFQHSRDAWSSVGATGLTLSILSALLALAASWMTHSCTLESGA
ncbi:hypothetical protein KFK14_19560 [Sphingobium phenoxybenzoativorans]|uniref:DUF2231 domain-containing protein n=1 Tax=Sphingobium phenoxybenzoativorans TaxID=1592790 RepID=A0A975Q1A2_9SPHN|nr:DUF2231 domain-containing protein [Sphingobium phenoxybenzoativorans]QUT05172.1 hypothetical protein KFK14_19560 [Sphingobium phenoxybenzoativorans]